MTKNDLVLAISKQTGIDKTTVMSVVEGLMDSVKTSLGNEDNVYLRGFGSFIRKKRAAKTARNISRNTTIVIPAFKPSKEFIKLVTGSENANE